MSEEPKKHWYQKQWYENHFNIWRALGATAIVAFGLGLFMFVRDTTPDDFSNEIFCALIGVSISTPFMALGFLFRHLWIGVILGTVIGGFCAHAMFGISQA